MPNDVTAATQIGLAAPSAAAGVPGFVTPATLFAGAGLSGAAGALALRSARLFALAETGVLQVCQTL